MKTTTKLLTPPNGNSKTSKSEEYNYYTPILHLAPYKLSGYNVCPNASDGCIKACLNTAGRGGIIKKGETTNVIQTARINRTKHYYQDREGFLNQLAKEIRLAKNRAENKGLKLAVRLNGTSDIRWEKDMIQVSHEDFIKYYPDNKALEEFFNKYGSLKAYGSIFNLFPDVQFYDYTKHPNRKNIPVNYHLTFSRAEDNDEDIKQALKNGLNIAVVFEKYLPETFLGLPVIDGDKNDLRFLDPVNSIVGLVAKGKAKKDETGFVVSQS